MSHSQILEHITNCMDFALPEAVHANIHDAPPPPLTTYEHIRQYLFIEDKPTHKEAWFIDLGGIRNHFTERDHFRTAGGEFHLATSLRIRGLYSNFQSIDRNITPAEHYRQSYREQWTQAQKISLTLAANRRVPGTSANLMLFKCQVLPYWFSEIFLFVADLNVEVLAIES